MEHEIISILRCFLEMSYSLRSSNMLQRKNNITGTLVQKALLYYLSNETSLIEFKQNFKWLTKERYFCRLLRSDILCAELN